MVRRTSERCARRCDVAVNAGSAHGGGHERQERIAAKRFYFFKAFLSNDANRISVCIAQGDGGRHLTCNVRHRCGPRHAFVNH